MEKNPIIVVGSVGKSTVASVLSTLPENITVVVPENHRGFVFVPEPMVITNPYTEDFLNFDYRPDAKNKRNSNFTPKKKKRK